MRRLWDWYRARRWWAKILIAVPSVLFVILVLYVATRGLQYATAGGDACSYVPAAANFVAGVRDLSGEWERIQQGEGWKGLQKKALRDRAFRAEVDSWLKQSGLPTLDQIDDRRWMDQHPEYRESTILRAAGRDAMVALRVGEKFETAHFLAATKVRFTDYLLLPFAGLAAGLAGAKKEAIANRTCLRIAQGKKEYFAVIDDAYVVLSDDRGLLADGLRKKGKRPVVSRPFWLHADFGSSAALAKWRKKFHGFPGGAVLPFMNAETARSMELEAGVAGSTLLVDVRLDGARLQPGSADPALAGFAPQSSSAFEVQAADMSHIYDWLKSLIVPDPKATAFDKFVQKQASDSVAEFSKAGFEPLFLSRVQPPMAVILGSEVGTKEHPYTTGAFVMKSQDPAGAVQGLETVFQKMLQKFGTFSTEWRGNTRIVYFDRPSDPLDLNNYLRPCMSAVGDTVVVGNNLAFTEKVVDAGMEQSTRFLQLPVFRDACKRMKAVGFDPPGTGDVGGGFVVLSALREGLQGHLPEVATKSVEAVSPMAKIRQEIERELRAQNLQLTVEEIDDRVMAERQRRIDVEIEKSERSLKPMEYVRWIAFGVRAKGDGAALRLAVEIR